MIVTLKTQQLQTLADVRAFLGGDQLVSFEAAYAFVSQQLRSGGEGPERTEDPERSRILRGRAGRPG